MMKQHVNLVNKEKMKLRRCYMLMCCTHLGIKECLHSDNGLIYLRNIFHELKVRWQLERTGCEIDQKRKLVGLLQLYECS